MIRIKNMSMRTNPEKRKLRIELKKGDDCWMNSLWITHWWFGQFIWHVIFIELVKKSTLR